MFEGVPTVWKKWRRTEKTPGHTTIWVLCNGAGVVREGKADNEVQCSTLDRIPFRMKAADLFKRYEQE